MSNEEQTPMKAEAAAAEVPVVAEKPADAEPAGDIVKASSEKNLAAGATKAEEESGAAATVEVTSEQPKKKKGIALPKPNFTPKYYKDVEYQNRDKNNLHPDIKVNFSDVIAEPDGAHSFATIWGTSFKTYSITKYWCYRILTAVLAVPLSVFWGLYFALLAFCSIWCIAPCIKGFIIWTNFVSKIWGLMVRTFLDPLFESIGLIFTKIQVTMKMNNVVDDDGKQS